MSRRFIEKNFFDVHNRVMTDRHQAPSYPLRMPAELRECVVNAAKTSGRSLHAELIARLQQSFEATQADTGPLSDLIAAQKKTISTQDVTVIMLQAYLIDVINALPKKLQSDERIKIAAKFAMNLSGGNESQEFQIPLEIGQPTQPNDAQNEFP